MKNKQGKQWLIYIVNKRVNKRDYKRRFKQTMFLCYKSTDSNYSYLDCINISISGSTGNITFSIIIFWERRPTKKNKGTVVPIGF
jgi:hypothetical protein